MKGLILAVLAILALSLVPHGVQAASTNVLGADHWSLGFTASYVTHTGDAVPGGTEFNHGYQFRLPVALSVFSPPPGESGLRLSLFAAPGFLTDTKFKNGSPGWDVGLAFGIWQGRVAP
jgi:hypothetical protein